MNERVDGGDRRVRNVAILLFLLVFAWKLLPILSADEFFSDLIVFFITVPPKFTSATLVDALMDRKRHKEGE